MAASAAASQPKTYGIALGVGQQVAARGELHEQRRVDRHIRIFPHADPQAVRLDRRERRARIGKARLVPFEIEARLDLPCGAPVQRQHVARELARAQLRGDLGGFLGRLVVVARNPEAEAPARASRRAAGELRVLVEDRGRRVRGEQEQVERLVVDLQRVRAVRPVRIADAVRDRRRRVHEHAPGARAGAGTPRERRVLVREPGVDAERVDDVRIDELSALVERAELLAEAVHRLARAKRERGKPPTALPHAAEGRQPRGTAEMLVGDRARDRRAAMEQSKTQRRRGDLERRLARR